MDKLENVEELSRLLDISDKMQQHLLELCGDDVQDALTVLALTTGEFAAKHQFGADELEEAVSYSYQQTIKDQAERILN